MRGKITSCNIKTAVNLYLIKLKNKKEKFTSSFLNRNLYKKYNFTYIPSNSDNIYTECSKLKATADFLTFKPNSLHKSCNNCNCAYYM